jgi:holo-[acyl-carrier protein] synthase
VLLVGVDVVEVSEIADSLARFGDHYVRRVYTEAEAGARKGPLAVQAVRFAECFAAKEAALKAFGDGDASLDPRSIELLRDLDGRFQLRFSGVASEMARRAGITVLRVSASRAGDLVMALVVATGA